MNFEQKLKIRKSLVTHGVTTSGKLFEYANDIRKLLTLGLTDSDKLAVYDLADVVGKVNPFFDWLFKDGGKQVDLLRALKKQGVGSAKQLADFRADPDKFLYSGLNLDQLKATNDLYKKVGKVNAFFDWFMGDNEAETKKVEKTEE